MLINFIIKTKMKRLYDKLEKLARKLEKEGKAQSSVEVYERLGRVRGEHLQNAVNVAYRNGLYSLGLNLCNKYLDGREGHSFESKAIGVGREGRFLNIKLCKELADKKDPDNERYDQGPGKIYYKN